MGGSIRQRRWFPFWNHHASHGEEEIKEGRHKVIPECCQGWLVGTGRVAQHWPGQCRPATTLLWTFINGWAANKGLEGCTVSWPGPKIIQEQHRRVKEWRRNRQEMRRTPQDGGDMQASCAN